MNREPLLLLLTALGSALCWWPVIQVPNIGLPFYVPYLICAGVTSSAILLSDKPKSRIAAAAIAGSFSGYVVGLRMLPLGSDGIAHSYWPFELILVTLATAVMAAVLILALRRVIVPPESVPHSLWLALILCVGACPAAVALTPLISSSRISRNERLAAERVKALQTAVEASMAQNGNPGSYCGGEVIKRHYTGPSFSDGDWRLITSNYVTRQGYAFMVFCPEKGGYRISAMPHNFEQDGNRKFCSDVAGEAGCTTEEKP